jgi:hypothetical protein
MYKSGSVGSGISLAPSLRNDRDHAHRLALHRVLIERQVGYLGREAFEHGPEPKVAARARLR